MTHREARGVRSKVLAALVASGALLIGACHSNGSQTATLAAARTAQRPPHAAISGDETLTLENVRAATNRVAEWQYAQYNPDTNLFNEDPSADGHPQGWVYAVLHAGLAAHARVENSAAQWDRLRSIAVRNRWGFAPRLYNADDYAIGQLYLDLAEHFADRSYLATTQQRLHEILARPPRVDLAFVKSGNDEILDNRRWGVASCKDRWCWCDALFMAPPVWMKMGNMTADRRYVDYADREFWATADYLYDKDERLFFRDSRYFDQRADNGAKIFWGRGNGWVIAGIARTLAALPADHPRKADYVALFRALSGRLASLQTADGYWRSSLLQPAQHETPETSAAGLIVFALAWGVNNGYLDEAEFRPVIERGWRGLVRAIHPSGKLGWVQQVASAPGSATHEDTQLYGVGAFLMAGAEIIGLLNSEQRLAR